MSSDLDLNKTGPEAIHDEDVGAEKGLPTEGKHSAGNALLVTADGEIRKLPVPSDDPNDPLNFTKWEKLGISVACCWFCKCIRDSFDQRADKVTAIMSLSLSGSLGAILGVFFGIYIQEGHTTDEVVRLLTFPALFIGVGKLE